MKKDNKIIFHLSVIDTKTGHVKPYRIIKFLEIRMTTVEHGTPYYLKNINLFKDLT